MKNKGREKKKDQTHADEEEEEGDVRSTPHTHTWGKKEKKVPNNKNRPSPSLWNETTHREKNARQMNSTIVQVVWAPAVRGTPSFISLTHSLFGLFPCSLTVTHSSLFPAYFSFFLYLFLPPHPFFRIMAFHFEEAFLYLSSLSLFSSLLPLLFFMLTYSPLDM